jgi:hypothetical protein
MDRRPAVPVPLIVAGRVLGAALLAATAGMHLYLWDTGYRSIDWIGPLFLLQAVTGFLIALAVLSVPQHWLSHAAVLGALLQLGTLVGLLLSVEVGLFGFFESTRATLFWPSVWTEASGALVLLALAAVRPRTPSAGRAPGREVRAGR